MQVFPSDAYSLADGISALAACIGGGFAVWQYRTTNKQAAARAAADEIERFNADEHVKLAFRLIDWCAGSFSYTDEFGVRHKKGYRPLDFKLALRPHTKRRSEVDGYDAAKDEFRKSREANAHSYENSFSPAEQHVRDAFDGFLSRLERIESLIRSNVIPEKNFQDYFSYWIKIIGDENDPSENLGNFSNTQRETLIAYINQYEFNGVIRLFKRYGRDIARPKNDLSGSPSG
ncbi:hypothetical protein U8Q05_26855 (plasmid) [Rhizobium ruizarguesonis]|nr:hypothetical protein U8Q05_26855 [Rhizobium ruizarguesonis]